MTSYSTKSCLRNQMGRNLIDAMKKRGVDVGEVMVTNVKPLVANS